ncbi:glutamate ABC transporter substrate-binding protein [Gordonia jinhuaensis]|uniref:Glutamate ABC transporter, periplasmic protein n=1 Tax=Gordonia jinhuaensis TaxID=1517702 RepID=A0A916T382_9ACTN|nr:glutamate ABC transporter substrate-binding protein [Gordonia jinhuaensis]GGB26118.1 putative glutamate ABC transporter, periplasmic protein [Gordonia jinhuaensis]
MRRAFRVRATLALAVAAVSSASLVSACGSSEPRNLIDSIRSGSVILGTKYDQPGLGLRHPDKKFSGFDVSVSEYVVDTIADRLGVKHPKITWRETPSAQRETLIGNGEVDMIAATYSITPSRAKKVAFAGPYLVTYQGLMVRKDDTSITTLADLNRGKKLCSVTGSTPAQNVKKQLPGVQLQEYDSYSSCVEALQRNKVDAMTTDEMILAGFSNFDPGKFKLVGMEYAKDTCVNDTYKKAGAPFSTEYYGIGMAKDQPDTVKEVNSVLQQMLTPATGSSVSPWSNALQKAVGAEEVNRMRERAGSSGSKYTFTPQPGNLSFLDAPSTPCPKELS